MCSNGLTNASVLSLKWKIYFLNLAFICSIQRRAQSSRKYLGCSVLQLQPTAKAVSFCYKLLHFLRLRKSWMCLWYSKNTLNLFRMDFFKDACPPLGGCCSPLPFLKLCCRCPAIKNFGKVIPKFGNK